MTEKPRFSITINNKLLEAMTKYQYEHRISTRSKAASRLIEIALNIINNDTEEEDTTADLVDRIDSLCERNAVKRAELERILGLGHGSISKWKDHAPSAESIFRVAEYFGVSMESILIGEKRPTKSTPKIDGLLLNEDELHVLRGFRVAPPNIQKYIRDMTMDALNDTSEI